MTDAIDRDDVDKLGEEIRHAGSFTAASHERLIAWRDVHWDTLAEVVGRVQERMHVACGARIKTPSTILDKLIRMPRLRLSEIQDIAGVRVILPVSLPEQDVWARRIAALFQQEGRLSDRRSKPSHGYRALHVVLTVRGLKIEVQVRTEFQHVWAALMERFAGVYGRQIQYGQLPVQPDDPGVKPTAGVDPVPTRSEIIHLLQDISPHIASTEHLRALLFRAEVDLLPVGDAPPDKGNAELLKNFRRVADESVERLRQPTVEGESRVRFILGRLAMLEPC